MNGLQRKAAGWMLAAVIGSAAAGEVAAADCPVEGGRDAVLEALGKAPACKSAYALLEACSWGSSQDVEFADIVVRKCETAFPAGMSGKARSRYEQGKKRCQTKYAHQQGTMYISFAALCVAKLAATTAGGKN